MKDLIWGAIADHYEDAELAARKSEDADAMRLPDHACFVAEALTPHVVEALAALGYSIVPGCAPRPVDCRVSGLLPEWHLSQAATILARPAVQASLAAREPYDPDACPAHGPGWPCIPRRL